MESWDDIYRKEGMVQKNPSEFVVDNIGFLKENGVKSVLDLGCGTGRHLKMLIKEGFEVTGMDKSEKAVKMLRRALDEKNFEGVRLDVSDFVKLPYESGSFDAIVCINVIQHATVDRIRQAAKEMDRVLKDGGVLLLTTLSANDEAYGMGEKVGENTYVTGVSPDGGVPHHFFSEKELKDVFGGFNLNVWEKDVSSPLREIKNAVSWFAVGVKK